MSINSIYNNPYASVSSLLQGLGINMNDADGSSAGTRGASSPSSPSASSPSGSKGSGLYANASGTAQGLAAAVKAAMDDMNLSDADKISFQTLMDYRERLQSQFTEQVRKDLLAEGVDKDVEFRLVSGSDGTGVRVLCDNPDDRAKIEKYFKDNPDMVSQFEKLQGLNKMEEARKSRGIDVKSIQSRIQMESMTTWFSDTSSFMAFSAQGAAYYSGINTFA